MNKLEIIRQGASLPFSFDRGGLSIDGWTCTIYVKEKPSDADDGVFASRVITPSDGAWTGFLTQTETAALPVLPKGAAYYLIALKTNTTTDEEEEEADRVRVTTKWV